VLSAFLNPKERTVYLESEVMQMYKRAIVDELGYVMYWCSELSDKEIMRILAEYPEATIKCVEMEE
jgi:hypothetical protein